MIEIVNRPGLLDHLSGAALLEWSIYFDTLHLFGVTTDQWSGLVAKDGDNCMVFTDDGEEIHTPITEESCAPVTCTQDWLLGIVPSVLDAYGDRFYAPHVMTFPDQRDTSKGYWLSAPFVQLRPTFDEYLLTLISRDRYTVRKSFKQGFAFEAISSEDIASYIPLLLAMVNASWDDEHSRVFALHSAARFVGEVVSGKTLAFVTTLDGVPHAISGFVPSNQTLIFSAFFSTRQNMVGTYTVACAVAYACGKFDYFDPSCISELDEDDASYLSYKKVVANSDHPVAQFFFVRGDKPASVLPPYCLNGDWFYD